MSCFIVSDEHISAILQAAEMPNFGTAYYHDDKVHYFKGNIAKAANKLKRQNYRSYNYRYKSQLEPLIHINYYTRPRTPVEILKLLDSYDYQSSETPDWTTCEARAITHALRKFAIQELPGYRQADWQVQEETRG